MLTLKPLLKKQGLKQIDLARATGLDTARISRIVNGDLPIPKSQMPLFMEILKTTESKLSYYTKCETCNGTGYYRSNRND